MSDPHTFNQFAVRVLRNWFGIARFAAITVALVVAISLLLPRQYTSKGSFLVAGGDQAGSTLAGLASQFGVNVAGGDPGQSPYFYADLMASDNLLGAIVESRYRTSRDSGEDGDTLLAHYLAGSYSDPRIRHFKALEAIRNHVSTETGPVTGVVTFRVTLDDPLLAKNVATKALELVNEFNVRRRQAQASAQRQFLESQVDGMAEQLRQAEDSLQAFLLRNRNYQSSPMLGFEAERLERAVGLKQAAFTQLFQAFLQAQASELQNTPVVVTVGTPLEPAVPNPRRLPMRSAAALIVALVLGVTWYAAREQWSDLLATDEELRESVLRARSEAIALLARIGRVKSGPRASSTDSNEGLGS